MIQVCLGPKTCKDPNIPVKVHLSLPKFSIEMHQNLVPIFKDLGMSELFSADFDGEFNRVSEEIGLSLGEVNQKATINVNEKGTLAASVTFSGFIILGDFETEIVEVVFDRPFSFYLFDAEANLTLFSGVVNNPSSS